MEPAHHLRVQLNAALMGSRLVYSMTSSNEGVFGVPADFRDTSWKNLSTIVTLFHMAPHIKDTTYQAHQLSSYS